MFRVIAQHNRFSASRRVAAVLLALILNVTLVPCTMAIEAAEEAHDCCPPELQLDASECCAMDDATLEARGVRLGLDDDNGAELLIAPAFADALAPRCVHSPEATGPPDTFVHPVPVYKLNCAYLE
jgi:predicted component of type VI protein secretion system